MSYITLKMTPPSGLLTYYGKLREAWMEERKVKTTIAELHRLSDRELNDIGIARSDIERVVRGL